MRVALDVLGAVLVVIAAFLVHVALGFLIAGCAVLLLNWRLAAEDRSAKANTRRDAP